jgi:hypothetical protein
MYLQNVISRKTWRKKNIFVGFLKVKDENSRIRIRIRTKMSRIRNTDFKSIINQTKDSNVHLDMIPDLKSKLSCRRQNESPQLVRPPSYEGKTNVEIHQGF